MAGMLRVAIQGEPGSYSEEAAALYMDELADDEAAETRCLEAIKIDPRREIAYARLHDLLAERGDDAALLDLVNARSELFDDPELLAPLMYEQARLFRTKHGSTVFLAGLLIAAFLAIPIVNLLTPLFAAALMVHLHKLLSRKDPSFAENLRR